MSEFPKEIWAAPEGHFGQGVDPIKMAPWTEKYTYEGSRRYVLADEWEATPQIGTWGHCSLAQVFRNGKSVATFDATPDPKDASAMARRFAEMMRK